MSRVAIIIPVYNEGTTLKRTLPLISLTISNINPSYRVIYVNDGSQDDTLPTLLELKKSAMFLNIEILSLEVNRGYGGALRFGAEYAYQKGYWAVVFMDSDLTNLPSEIPHMISQLNCFDLVKASRYIKGSSIKNIPLKRKYYSIVGNIMLRFLFRTSIKDITNGFRAWRLQEYLTFKCEREGFDSIIEEFYYARTKNYRITECPSILLSRGEYLRVSSASYSFQVFKNYLNPGTKYFLERLKRIKPNLS